MNHPTPTAADFFGQPYEEDDAEPVVVDEVWKAGPGSIYFLPPDPWQSIADSLSRMADHLDAAPARLGKMVKSETERERKTVPADDASAYLEQISFLQQSLTEAIADADSKQQTLTQVISDVEAALGKSTAKPALAAKAVIEAWKNPQVPVEETGDPETDAILSDPEAMSAIAEAEAEAVPVPVVAANPDNLPGHTRTPHPEGFDFCAECSGEKQEWITWPCQPVTDGLGSDMGANAVFVPDTAAGAQPEPQTVHPDSPPADPPASDAPVEEWREYARSLGHAGPNIDKANRSQIRTALGIAHTPQAGA